MTAVIWTTNWSRWGVWHRCRARTPAKPIEGHEVKTHHQISHRHAKAWACRSLTSPPTLRTPNPLWTADCPFEGAEEITHEDLPLPVGPRIAFKPGFIMPLEEGKSYFQMEDSSHAAHSRGKVWTKCCWKENLEIIKNFSLNLKSISIFPFLSQTASQNRTPAGHKKQSTKDRNCLPCWAGSWKEETTPLCCSLPPTAARTIVKGTLRSSGRRVHSSLVLICSDQ